MEKKNRVKPRNSGGNKRFAKFKDTALLCYNGIWDGQKIKEIKYLMRQKFAIGHQRAQMTQNAQFYTTELKVMEKINKCRNEEIWFDLW